MKNNALELVDYYQIGSPIDFAKGHYARVFEAVDEVTGNTLAFKVLRTEHVAPGKMRSEYQAFGLEACLLHHFREHDCVVNLRDCGFISDKRERPSTGKIVSLGLKIDVFKERLAKYNRSGWRPYLCEDLLPETHNLFVLLREEAPRYRRRFPTEEGLALALQFTDLLEEAHAENIAYLDAKLEHFYWDGKRLSVIDWNSSQMLGAGALHQAEAAAANIKDVRNFVIGVMYPVFTGLPAIGQMFQAMPSSREALAGRYGQVRDLDFGMDPSLAPCLIEIMQKATHRQYTDIQQFKKDLRDCARQHGWTFGRSKSSHAVEARSQILSGIQAVREAQTQLQMARQAFANASRDSGPNRKEAQRLLELTQTLCEKRIIP